MIHISEGFINDKKCLSGEIGRHEGLKILWTVMSV